LNLEGAWWLSRHAVTCMVQAGKSKGVSQSNAVQAIAYITILFSDACRCNPSSRCVCWTAPAARPTRPSSESAKCCRWGGQQTDNKYAVALSKAVLQVRLLCAQVGLLRKQCWRRACRSMQAGIGCLSAYATTMTAGAVLLLKGSEGRVSHLVPLPPFQAGS
jgi:hypothetical protein